MISGGDLVLINGTRLYFRSTSQWTGGSVPRNVYCVNISKGVV